MTPDWNQNNMAAPEVDLLSSGSEAQSASQYACKRMEVQWKKEETSNQS